MTPSPDTARADAISRLYQSGARQDMPWEAGDTILFKDITEFAAFEDHLIDYIDADPALIDRWRGRPPIGEMLRPKGYSGTIASISAVALEDPLETFRETAETREAKILNMKGRGIRFGTTHLEVAELAIGFSVQARATSTRQSGPIDNIETMLLYVPPVLAERKTKTASGVGYSRSSVQSQIEHGIRRLMIEPAMDVGAFEVLRAESEARARVLESVNLRHPYR